MVDSLMKGYITPEELSERHRLQRSITPEELSERIIKLPKQYRNLVKPIYHKCPNCDSKFYQPLKICENCGIDLPT